MASGNRNTGQRNIDRYSEEKEHYKSLREYFENLFNKTIWAIGIIFAFAGYFTYSSFKDLTEKAEKEVEETKAQALKEIEKIKEESKAIAHKEAVNKIQEVFKANNIELLVIEAAKGYMEPEIKNVIQKVNVEKNDRIIELLKSKDLSDKKEGASSMASGISNKFSENQLADIIEILKADGDDESYRPTVVSVLSLYKSKNVKDFFVYLSINEAKSPYIFQQACIYLTNPAHEPSFDVFIDAIKKKHRFNDNGAGIYSEFLIQSIDYNSKLSFKLLNSKEIVDYLYNNNKEYFEITRNNLMQQLKGKISEEELKSCYLFRKAIN